MKCWPRDHSIEHLLLCRPITGCRAGDELKQRRPGTASSRSWLARLKISCPNGRTPSRSKQLCPPGIHLLQAAGTCCAYGEQSVRAKRGKRNRVRRRSAWRLHPLRRPRHPPHALLHLRFPLEKGRRRRGRFVRKDKVIFQPVFFFCFFRR
jgi:hypothetical protein